MRKTRDIKIEWGKPVPPGRDPLPGENRDYGRTYRITEMPAEQAEEWGIRATLALIPRLSKEIDPDVAAELEDNPGMSSIARVGRLISGISFPETKDLMRELMRCVQIIPDPENNPGFVRPLGVGGTEDVAEVETLRQLREEVLNLHTGFTLAADIFRLISAATMTSPSMTT